MTTEQKWADFGSDVALMMAHIVLMLIMTWPIMWAWNYIVPSMFGLDSLSWGEALCLHFVASAFFGGPRYIMRTHR